MPASTDYKLKDYGFGSGGAKDASSGNYVMEAITGETSSNQLSGASYNLGPGLIFTNQANVPEAPVFNNPENHYNKLRIIINPSGNPSDTKFAIAISDDNFATTKFVQNDNTIGDALGAEDYQTYANWGGASGEFVIGLSSNKEYKVKAKAIQGIFTETGFGPAAAASTVNPTLSFNVSPNSINFGELAIGAVNNSPQNISVNIETNAENGGLIYVYGNNEGLYSSNAGHKIDAITDNLASVPQGFGAQSVSTSQSSGGPLAAVAPYNQSEDNVGAADQIIRAIFNTDAPIIEGNGVFRLKAKPSSVAPAAVDYTETLTVIAAGKF